MSSISKYYKELAALFVFIIYSITLASTVIHLDAGELAAVQSTLGIAHPTGYPLFTIIGFALSHLLFPFSHILALNLLAAFYCTAAVYFIFKFAELILQNFHFDTKNDKQKQLTSGQIKIISLVVGLSAAFSETFWFQSTSTEVYSLHLLLLSLIIYFTIKAYLFGKSKYWIITAIILAFAFANHMTTILILPGIAYLFFRLNKFTKESFLQLVKMLAVFLPILILLYSYLPFRASTQPSLNWGNPQNWENFFRHVSGKQYQVWIFSSFEAAEKQFNYFLQSLPQELGYVVLILSIIGLPLLFRSSKQLSIFFLINTIATIIYSINYDIVDIDSYFLLAYISITVFMIGTLVQFVSKLKSLTQPLLLAIPLILMIVNFSRVDQSDVYTFEDYTKAILDKAEKESILFSYLWDYFISPSYYFQFVEGYRSDVAVIDKELLRRSWYYNQLKNNMPNVVDNIEQEINSFLKAVAPFERSENFDPSLIEKNFQNLMTRLVATNVSERDFYITPELFENEMQRGQFSLPQGYTMVPMELFFKVVPVNSRYVEANPLDINIRYNNIEDKYQKQIRRLVSQMFIYRIAYELQFQKNEKAEMIFQKLQKDYPEMRIPSQILNRLSQ